MTAPVLAPLEARALPTPPRAVVEQAKPASGAGLALMVAGGVMVVGGGVGLGWSLTTYDRLQGQRATLPKPDVQVSRATFDQLAWIYPASWAALGVGAAAAVPGVVLTVRGSAPRVTPLVAPGTAGVSLSGTF